MENARSVLHRTILKITVSYRSADPRPQGTHFSERRSTLPGVESQPVTPDAAVSIASYRVIMNEYQSLRLSGSTFKSFQVPPMLHFGLENEQYT